MSNFECCKSKSFPSSYYICVNCFNVFHRSCVLKNKNNYSFIKGFKIRCCEHNDLKRSDEEKTFLEETISELTENTNLQEKHITQLKKDHEMFTEEASQREEEMDHLIKQQQEFIDRANKEILSLKQELENFSSKSTTTKCSQTERIPVAEKEIQTNNKITETRDTSTYTDSTNPIGIEEDKSRKILLIAGNHGKDMVHILKNYMETWTIESILKPNASNTEFAKTAIRASKHLTKEDFVVLWPNDNFTPFFKHLLTNIANTNFFILTAPYYPTNRECNDRIYYTNLSLFKEAHYLTGGLKKLIDVNSLIESKHYNRFGCYISKKGKQLIGCEIVRRILGNATDNHVTNSINTEGHTGVDDNFSVVPPAPSRLQDNADNIVSTNKIKHQHFLYPRLSQDILTEK